MDIDPTVCCIKGCDRPVVALGLCVNHWRRNKKYGSPVALKYHSGTFRGRSAEERFWMRVNKTEDCWIWTGGRDEDGYGVFRGKVDGRQFERAHRFSYALHNGGIPRYKHICHRCDNPPCVNPDHLFLGTNAINMADKIAKGRARVLVGESAPNARLTEDQVRSISADPRPYAAIAADFEVSFATVSDIKNRYSWRHLELDPVKGGPRSSKSNERKVQ